MAERFQEWVASIARQGPSDPGELSPAAMQFLQEIFDQRGPLPAGDVELAQQERQIELARAAVELVGADIRASTNLQPPPFEYRIDDGGVRVAYWGRYATSAISAMTVPHLVVEVADFMQEEIVEDRHAAWPVCPAHQLGTYSEIVDGRAVWYCRKHQHIVAAIGQLAR
jgi:hypothetical protein